MRLLGELLDEVIHQKRYVIAAFAQRRYHQGDDVEAIEQVGSETIPGDLLLEVTIRGGDDPDIRVVILTGKGKSFCAGADLHWMKKVVEYTFDESYEDSLRLARMLKEIYTCPKPVVGRINGSAIGGGTESDLLCGVRGSLVVFGTPETVDVTGDGFADDRFAQLYDAAADTLTPLPQPEGFGPGAAPILNCAMGPEVNRCVGIPGVSCADDDDCGGGFCAGDGTCRTVGDECEDASDCIAGQSCNPATLVAFEAPEIAFDLSGQPEITEPLLNEIEVGIRAYDPCLSCATHAMGQMPLEVTLLDHEGTTIQRVYKEEGRIRE